MLENDDSSTQETSSKPDFSNLRSNQDFCAKFRTRSDCHGKPVERYVCPIDNSENVFSEEFLQRNALLWNVFQLVSHYLMEFVCQDFVFVLLLSLS